MHWLRNSFTAATIVLAAMTNTLVLIVNPEQVPSAILTSTSFSVDGEEEGEIKPSHEGELFSSVQKIPGQESRLNEKTSLQPVPRLLQYYNTITPPGQVNIHKPGARYLPCRNMPELNDTELFILHRRLNT